MYIHKDFRNAALEDALLGGKKTLLERYRTTAVPSSVFACVYKFAVNFNGIEKKVYIKEHLDRSILDVVKHLVHASRARRAWKAAMMLAENGIQTPAVIAMGEEKSGLFNVRNFLVTLEVENALDIFQLICDRQKNLTVKLKRELIRAFGRTVGKMHANNIFHGDMRLGNVLVRQDENRWSFFFLDNERTKKFYRLPARLRLKNLVQVNMPTAISNTDRMRFFTEYCSENKNRKAALIKKILEKTGKRLSKKMSKSK